jgi:hypothetical protein
LLCRRFITQLKNVAKLNDVLMKFHPEYNSKLFTAEHIYAEVFDRQKFDYFKIKNISSDLYYESSGKDHAGSAEFRAWIL